jgi:NADH-ubiquinone oxidoreductase chain 5
MFIGSLALAGFPYLSGFYSKDNILESSYANYELHSIFAYILGSFSAFFTAFYSIRLLFLSFLAPNNQFKWNIRKLHEGDAQLSIPLLSLIFGSLFSGYFLKDLYIGFGSIFFDNSIFILSTHFSGFDLEFIPLIIKLIPTVFTILGFSLSFLFYNSNLSTFVTKLIIRVYIFLSTK